MKFYDRKKEIEILRRNWEKSAKHSLFYCDDRQKTYRKDASLAQDGARVEDCFLRFWFRFVLPNQALIETERNDLLLEIVERDYNDYTGLVLEQYFRQKIAEEERVTLVGNYWDRKGMNEIDLIALNDIDKTALVAEVKRNADRYIPKLLQEKFESIRSNFGKYNEVQLIGLSMQDM